MKWDNLRKYAEIFEFERDTRFDVYGVIDDFDTMIADCYSKKFGSYAVELLIFDFDAAPPSCKFLVTHESYGHIEVAFENERIAREFIVGDCYDFNCVVSNLYI